MKNLIFVFVLIGLLSCKEKVTPVSSQISRVWSANIVKENNTTVFTRGAGGNVKPGYNSFRLDLSMPGSVHMTELDGTLFTGQWTLSSDNKILTLSGLTPQPTGSKGTLTCSVVSASDKSLVLILSGASAKTGGSTNQYELINP